MAEVEVKIASRYLKRKRGVAVGKSLLKTLTEPITNSDDSYRRIIASSESSTEDYPIIITVDERDRTVRIVDRAEGMETAELKNKFEYYGSDKSGASQGKNVRGLFGQGLSDALFYHEKGYIKSIKNGQASICHFYEKRDKSYINVEQVDGDIEKISKQWGINSSHGTAVEFQLDSDTTIHRYEKLVDKLRTFYMLRFINADDNRLVKLIYVDLKGKKKESIIKYAFPQGDLILHEELSMKFEKYTPVKIDVELYKSPTTLITGGDEKESGLLIYDDKNAVYDLTFFGLDNLPNTDKFYGFIKLTGAREIILDKINHKRHPEEILTDSRDGFNRQHEFYKTLEQIMKDWLYPILNEERRKKSDDGLSEAIKQRHKQAFDELNKLYKQLAGDDSSGTIVSHEKKRPAGGLEFARNNITITCNKKYNLQLSVDTLLIKPGSVIQIESKNKKIAFTPSTILIEESEETDNIFIKSISVMGNESNTADTLTASSGKRSTTVVISVVPEEIYYPENGLAFYPEYLKSIPEKDSTLNLYVDLKLIKKGSVIKLTSSNESIVLRESEIVVEHPTRSSKSIARIGVVLSGKNKGDSATIEAIHNGFSATARVDIVDRVQNEPPSHAGKFKDWDFDSTVPEPFQQVFDSNPTSPTNGYILINPNHPINQKYFGVTPVKADIENNLHSQLYLAEIILNESLNVIIPEALQNGGLPRRLGGDYDVLYYIPQKKYELGQSIYDLFAQDIKPPVEADDVVQQLQSLEPSELGEGLKDREKLMLELKFGLNEQRPHTLEEIGRKFSVTRERVRQIIQRALAKKYQPEIVEEAEQSRVETEIEFTRDFIKEEEEKISNLQDKIIYIVAETYNLKVDEIKQRTRKATIAVPRQIAIYLIRDIIGISFPLIGDIFGLDHTTVIHAYEKIRDKEKTDETLKSEISTIRDRLNNNSQNLFNQETIEKSSTEATSTLDDIYLSNRARNALSLNGIATLQQLSKLTEKQVFAMKGFGIKTLQEIMEAVHRNRVV